MKEKYTVLKLNIEMIVKADILASSLTVDKDRVVYIDENSFIFAENIFNW